MKTSVLIVLFCYINFRVVHSRARVYTQALLLLPFIA